MLDQLMGAGYFSQGNDFRDFEPLPSHLKCLVETASGVDLCLGRHIVAADKEDSGVHKDKLPDRNFRFRHIRGVRCNGTALSQHLRIGLDICSESDLYNVMNSIGSRSPDAFHQAFTGEQNLVCSCSRSDFFVAFGAARSDYSPSRSVCELNSASSDRTSTTLHKNGLSLNRTRDMNSAMSGDAGNAETGTLFQRHACG
jgi:hypothetical protein